MSNPGNGCGGKEFSSWRERERERISSGKRRSNEKQEKVKEEKEEGWNEAINVGEREGDREERTKAQKQGIEEEGENVTMEARYRGDEREERTKALKENRGRRSKNRNNDATNEERSEIDK